ncbi:unnamed protein product [Mycena citricolor]|uniref:Cytochrome P450 n=1 Tax=Mycena citricolor TaxID=2018698 RepID=A0AAD2HAI8_9AGAR|nr:unnamed protein product [Mycena citricolor]
MGWGDILSFLPYGKRHTRHRQQHHNLLARKSCPAFYPVQTREARKLVRNLLHASGDQQHAALSRFSTAIITDILTGHEIVSDDDYFVRLAEQLYESFCVTGPPGGTLIDLFPLLRFFPDWVPGTYYARVAREWQDQVRAVYEYPVKYVQDAEASGTAQPSFLLSKLQNRGVSEEEEDLDLDELRADALTIFVTGQATTSSILTVFLLAMVLYPESQRRAQEEILHVLGADQIPAYEDRAKLPFVECVIQETLRWNPIVPLGVPHRLIQDDVYRGMLIPAGTTVYANIRAMSRDESVYHDPEAFQPERFLPRPEGRGEPRFASAFGFGRRLCTGNELASNSIWIAAATLLATCNIKNALDAAGRVIVPSTAMTDGIDCHPEHFPFAIEARSGLAALLDEEMRL